MSYSNSLEPGCRVEVRALPVDGSADEAGALLAAAEPLADGQWVMRGGAGKTVVMATTTEVLERMIGVAYDAQLAQRWNRMAAQLPEGSERAQALRECAGQLAAMAQVAAADASHARFTREYCE